MAGIADDLEDVSQAPTEIRISRSADDVRLLYRLYAQTVVDGKWFCVV
jgi:hypothetical protein